MVKAHRGTQEIQTISYHRLASVTESPRASIPVCKMGIKPILLPGLPILSGNRDFICVSPVCNGRPGNHEVLGYQNSAQVKGTI